MLIELHKFAQKIDSRYATDQELTQIEAISTSFAARLALYSKLARAEEQILNELYRRIAISHPNLFILNNKNVVEQCKNEVRYTFHHAIQALLLGEDWLQEDLLLWFQTIIRSLRLQPVCKVIYTTLENLLSTTLPSAESQMICPIIQTVKQSLTQP
ncbi:MAG TPA: hypothetical protein V6D10_22895 [Trichocoleus sp.]|jgi:hypothetical protein